MCLESKAASLLVKNDISFSINTPLYHSESSNEDSEYYYKYDFSSFFDGVWLEPGKYYKITSYFPVGITLSDNNLRLGSFSTFLNYGGVRYYFDSIYVSFIVQGIDDGFLSLGLEGTFLINGEFTDPLGFVSQTGFATFYCNDYRAHVSVYELSDEEAAAYQGSDVIKESIEEGNQLQQESNDLQKEENETSKNIFSSMSDFFGGFFDNLINSIIGIFVPSSEELQGLFDRLNTFFSDTFGFLYYPFDFIIQAFNIFMDSDSSTGMTFPGFSIMGYEVWQDYTYDIGADEVAGTIFNYVRIGTGAILSMFFIGYLRNFFEKRFGGGGS